MKRDTKEIDIARLHTPVEIDENLLKEHDPFSEKSKAEKEQLEPVNSMKAAERCWLVGEIEAAAARNADYLQVKYKVNEIICKHIVDINKWKKDNIFKRVKTLNRILDVWDFNGFVKDEDSIELIYKD